MGDLAEFLFPDLAGAAAQRAQRLAALRKQRMLLTGLREEIDISMRMVSARPAESRWRSDAARRYADRREELGRDLRRVLEQADESLAAIDRAILSVE
jgi:hypothetical protein